jgi:hypothetical protein
VTEFAKPTDADYEAMDAAVPGAYAEDETFADNFRFHALYNLKTGFFSANRKPANIWTRLKDGTLKREKTRLSRREWIERFYPLLDEDKNVVLMKYRSGQRKCEAVTLRMERAQMPVRLAILKSRKHGCSSWAIGVEFHQSLRLSDRESLVVGDTDERAEMLLAMATIARTRMPRAQKLGLSWVFKMASKAAHKIKWHDPIGSSIQIASAQRDDPGIGGTPTIIHGSEVAVWADANAKAAALFNAIPTRPGTIAIMESTARGSWGLFYNTFITAWKEREKPLNRRTTSWVALFIPWYEHAEYRWTKTYGRGKAFPDYLRDEIMASLDEHERFLLTLTYQRRWEPEDAWEQHEGRWRRRSVGQVNIDLDQLAWRRMKIKDPECGGDINLFNREFPWCMEVSWTASGNPVFDPEEVRRLATETIPPVWRGDLVAA